MILAADCDPTFSYDATAKRADLLFAEWGTNVADPEQYLQQALQTGSYGSRERVASTTSRHS